MKTLKILFIPFLLLVLWFNAAARQNDTAPISAKIAPGFSAFPLEVDLPIAAMAGYMDRVDILMDFENASQNTVVATLLQDVLVLDSIIVQDKNYLILALGSPMETTYLALAAQRKTKVILRATDDRRVSPIEIVELKFPGGAK